MFFFSDSPRKKWEIGGWRGGEYNSFEGLHDLFGRFFFLRFLKFEVLKLRDFAMYIVTFFYFVSFC